MLQLIFLLRRGGYIGNEPNGDGVNMHHIIFYPDETGGSPAVQYDENVR